MRRSFSLPRLLVAGALLGMFAVSGTAGPTGHAQSDLPCELLLGRTYPSIEGPWVARWDNEVTVVIALTADCRRSSPGPEHITVRERLPAGLSYAGTDDVPPTDVTAGGPMWRLAVPDGAANDAGIVDVRLSYRVLVRPVGLPMEPSGEVRVAWPTVVHALRDGQATELPVTRQMALPVRLVRPEGACRVNVQRSYAPSPAAAGAPITATLHLEPLDCRRSVPRQIGMIALQPVRRAEDVTRTLTTVRAVLNPLTPATGELGVLVNRADGPRVAPPSTVLEDILPLVRSMTPDPLGGGDARQALREALDRVPDVPLHHGVILYIGDSAAPHARPELVDEVLAEADARGVEVVTVCLGGGCDPAVRWQYTEPNLHLLRFAFIRGLMDAHRGQPLELERVTVEDHVPAGARWLDAAGGPEPERDGSGRLVWRNMPLRADQPLTLRYHIRAPDERGLRFVGDGQALLRYRSGEDLLQADPMRLPRAPLEVTGPLGDVAPPPCVPRLDKQVWQPSILRGEEADLHLEFTASCTDLLRDSDVVLALDVSGSMDANKLTDVQVASRSLLARAASPRVHVGIVTFNERVQARLPLAGDYRPALAAIDNMGFPLGRGQGSTNVARALHQVRAELQHRRDGAAAWVVLMSDGRSEAEPMREAAAALERDGATVITVCFGGDCPAQLREAASAPRFHYEVLTGAALDQLFESLGLRFRERTIRQASFVDELPADMPLVPGSDAPTAAVSPDGRTLRWDFGRDQLPFRTRLDYRVTPQRLGTHPTNVRAEVHFVDELGRQDSALFPVPEVTVYDRDGRGPCTPSLDRTPERAVAVLDALVTTTLTARLDCPARLPRLEIVLAIDRSDSMRAQGRLDGAVAAGQAFLDALEPEGTRVGLVAFNERVTTELPLDEDWRRVRDALDALEPGGGTSITGALRAAERLLAERRPETAAVVLLLTDGQEAAGAVEAMLEAASTMKEDGIRIATVCAGSCDPELDQVASGPDSAFDVGDPAALRDLFRDLAARFATPLPRDVRIVDAYPRWMKMVELAYAPLPDAFRPSQAEWRLPRLPDTGGTWKAAGRPQQPGELRVHRFARLEYAYGFPPELGWAYFPDAWLDVITPTPTSTPTPEPTRTPIGGPTTATPEATATTEPRAPWRAYVPWAGQRR